MTTDQVQIFGLLFFVFVFLIWGRWRYDLVAFSALLIAAFTGVVPSDEVFSGFGHPAVVVIALVLIVSRGLSNSGVIELLARYFVDSGRKLAAHIGIMSGFAAVLSAVYINLCWDIPWNRGVRDCIDAVEGFNARVHDPRRNQRAQNWALANGFPLQRHRVTTQQVIDHHTFQITDIRGLGAKVLQIRSVEFAKKYNVVIHVRSSFEDKPGTLVMKEDQEMETVEGRR